MNCEISPFIAVSKNGTGKVINETMNWYTVYGPSRYVLCDKFTALLQRTAKAVQTRFQSSFDKPTNKRASHGVSTVSKNQISCVIGEQV